MRMLATSSQDDGNKIEKGDLGIYLKGIMDKDQGAVASKVWGWGWQKWLAVSQQFNGGIEFSDSQ